MIFREAVMGMMGERRLTGRVEVGWTAAVFHLASGTLWVADVDDAGPAGIGMYLDAPAEKGDTLEIALRDPRGCHARVTGQVVFKPRSLDQRVGIQLTALDGDYVNLMIAAFQAEILAQETRANRSVDYGLAEVTPLPVTDRAPEGAAVGWSARQIGEVIPYRRAALAGELLPTRSHG